MAALNLKRRRTAATRLADHAEACEVRVLLSGVAIYPLHAVENNAETMQPEGKVNPFVLSPSDYQGSWSIGFGLTLNLSVQGSDPETAKVQGTVVSASIVGGTVKFKGKISNGIELNGKFHAKFIELGPAILKFKAQLSVHLTDSTHFEGTLHFSPKGHPEENLSVIGIKA